MANEDGLVYSTHKKLGRRNVICAVRTTDAQLIAAAPDLLAACRCALADMEGSYSREDWDDDENPVALTIRELIAAIAKAGGGK